MNNSIIHDYKKWLIGMVTDEDHLHYSLLLDYLFDTEFVWTIQGDGNRAEDGIHLRNVYCDSINQPTDIFEDGPCTVLEMMIALSIRCYEDILWDGENNWTPFIFWSMINNLGLIDSVDCNFNLDYVTEKIGIFLSRNYDENGVGGLFVCTDNLSHFPKSWKKLEIWYQMQKWISENFV